MEIGAVFAGLKKMRFSTACASAMCLSFILGVLWLHGNAGQVHACKCAMPGSPTDELEKSDAVFAGAVVSIRHSFDPDEGPYSPEDRTTVRFNVSAVWKGAVHEDTNITTPPTGGSCGFPFKEGEEYIVYAFDSAYEGDGYTAGICSRTAPLALAQEDLSALGEGHVPLTGRGGPSAEQSGEAVRSRMSIIIVAVAAIALLAGGIAAYAVVRRR